VCMWEVDDDASNVYSIIFLSYQMQYMRQWRLLDGYRAGYGEQRFPCWTGSRNLATNIL
jgi:hypothetical protein